MSRRNFQGNVIVISGAGGGLGRALAERFARDRARLVLLDVDRAGAEQTAGIVGQSGGEGLALACDVTDAGACQAAVRAGVERFGRVDMLVNNAGLSHRSAFARTDPAVIRHVVEVNFFGAVNLTHAALPFLLQSRGAIAAISSVAGFTPLIARTGYAASKHALHGFFGSLRTEVQPQGVDVTIACPSFIAMIFGKPNMDGLLAITFNGATVSFGAVLGAILNFLIIAVAVYFCILVPINKFRDMTEALLAKTKLAEQKEAEEKAAEEPSAEEQTVQLLQQIRDELAKQNAARN